MDSFIKIQFISTVPVENVWLITTSQNNNDLPDLLVIVFSKVINYTYVTYITLHGEFMAIGESGRIVLEVEPELKRKLYSELALEHKSLKNWFILMAESYIQTRNQSDLFSSSNNEAENQ